MIVEYAEHGCLRDYLRSHANESQSGGSGGTNEGYERPNSERPTISEKQLISFARQVGRKHNKKFSSIHIHKRESPEISKSSATRFGGCGPPRTVNKGSMDRYFYVDCP